MNYEWNPNKARSNYKKHGVRFADAVGVFEDENARERKIYEEQNEEGI